MKKLFFLSLLLSVSFSFAQSKNKTTTDSLPVNDSQAVINDDNAIYNTAGIAVKPEFPGGPTKMYEFIEKNFVKPEGEIIKGKVYVTLVIEKDGTLTNIKVLRDLGYGTGKESIRVLKMMPNWSSGEQNGRKVRCTYSFPITVL
ncbi:MAG: energy transducer TonB [Flavobacterium sp.]|nr:energy transducer TonB [Flavobacterium sp.]